MRTTKDKILILLAPIALLVFGYAIFFATPSDPAVKEVKDTFLMAQRPDEKRPSRVEMYRQAYEKKMHQPEKQLDNYVDFFGEEIQKQHPDTPREEKPQEGMETTIDSWGTATKAPSFSANSPEKLKKHSAKKRVPSHQINPSAGPPVVRVEPSSEPVMRKRRRTGFVDNQPPPDTLAGGKDSVGTQTRLPLPVVVLNSVRVRNGNTIYLRSTEPSRWQGHPIPMNTVITGRVQLNQDKIDILVTSLPVGNTHYRVNLSAHALDGTPGLPLEGGVNKEIKGEAVNDVINEATQHIDVPILRDVPRIGRRKVDEPVVPIQKGLKLLLL